jgi:hypothetical protein
LIFDIRAPSQLEKKGTILGSIHLKPLRTLQSTPFSQNKHPIDLASLSEQSLSQGMQDKIKHVMRNFCFIIGSDQNLTPSDFDEDPTKDDVKTVCIDDLSPTTMKDKVNEADAVSIQDGLELYEALHSQKVRELYLLGDGLENFLRKYSFLSFSTVSEKEVSKEESKTNYFNYPNEIVDQIFLGNVAQVKDKEILKTLKITHVLNTAEEIEICPEDLESIGIKYTKLPLRDFQDFDISEYFEDAFKSISEITEEDPKK